MNVEKTDIPQIHKDDVKMEGTAVPNELLDHFANNGLPVQVTILSRLISGIVKFCIWI